ncbi:hypothetical protein E2C01_090980 [Portunus trituberculatus]|uniref:Uncharacterized protein n=1 Tax=Portunus trituberculatus TaxID=210409 RepID=A0A5B7JTV1_PORTR|nr:hypothetical protein [Portunus trituberculatus]
MSRVIVTHCVRVFLSTVWLRRAHFGHTRQLPVQRPRGDHPAHHRTPPWPVVSANINFPLYVLLAEYSPILFLFFIFFT